LIHGSGFVLEKRDVGLLEIVLQKAMAADVEKLGAQARHLIASKYPEERRERELLQLLKKL
jgi:hypothetical protein